MRKLLGERTPARFLTFLKGAGRQSLLLIGLTLVLASLNPGQDLKKGSPLEAQAGFLSTPTPTAPQVTQPFTRPFFISPSSYHSQYQDELQDQQPLVVRGVAADPYLDGYDAMISHLANITEPGVGKLIGFSSYRTLEEKLSAPGPAGYATHADYLLAIGVTGFTYNTETSPGGSVWTPQDEMDALFNTDPQTNSVAIFARTARAHGFDQVVWVPYRHNADGYLAPGVRAPDYQLAFQVMYSAGLSGVGLQEQNYVDQTCAADRVAAFTETYLEHSQAAGGTEPQMLVNLTMEACTAGDPFAVASCGLPPIHPPWQHCNDLVDGIAGNLDLLSVPDQASSQLVTFFQVLRSAAPLEVGSFLPLLIH